jgi:hypothetical protein
MEMYRKKIKHIIIIIFMLIIILIDLSNCKSAVKELDSEDIYIKKIDSKRNDDSVVALSIYQNEDGSMTGILSSPFINGAEFRGEIKEDANGDISFYIEEYYALCNWPNGWTDMTNEATGHLIFEYNKDSYRLNIKYEPEIWDIKSGGVRYFDDFYLGDKGTAKVKDRIARINAIDNFLKEQNFPEYFGHLTSDTSYGPEFHDTIEDFLFNENMEYPEYLIDLKKYGTVLRDFEEANGLMFIQYNMDYFINELLPGSVFIEKKD